MQRQQDPAVRAQRLAEVQVISARLRDHARQIAMDLLPNGHEEAGKYWRVGSIAGEPGQSLCIDISGPSRGRFFDFNPGHGDPEQGDMLDLVRLVRFGGRMADAMAWARSWLGLDGLDPNRLASEQANVQRRARAAEAEARKKAERMVRHARALFMPQAGCVPIVDTPAEYYLAARGIDLACLEVDGQRYTPRAIAFHPAVLCTELGKDRHLPAMIARIINQAGEHIGTHRTWLVQDSAGNWGKAPLANPKKVLGDFAGGYIPLWKGACRKTLQAIDDGVDVLLSEGIEDGLSAACARPDKRVIAGVSLSNFGNLPIPPRPNGRLVILKQNDPDGSPAAHALDRAIAKQQERGVTVAIAEPPQGYKDMNDMVRGVGPAAVAA